MLDHKKRHVTISVNSDALAEVDRYIKEHKEAGATRSGVFAEALRLWRREQRRLSSIELYSAPRSEEELVEAADWARIRDANMVFFGRRFDEPELKT